MINYNVIWLVSFGFFLRYFAGTVDDRGNYLSPLTRSDPLFEPFSAHEQFELNITLAGLLVMVLCTLMERRRSRIVQRKREAAAKLGHYQTD